MDNETKKICPLLTVGILAQNVQKNPNEPCLKENCAWWCKWLDDCAMVGVAAVLTDLPSNMPR